MSIPSVTDTTEQALNPNEPGNGAATKTPSKAPANTAAPRRQKTGVVYFWIRFGVSVLMGLLVLGAGGGLFAFLASLKKDPQRREPIPRSITVEAFDVQPSTLLEITSAFGTARSDRQVIVAAQVAGEVKETFKLEVGEFIKAPEVTADDKGESRRLLGEQIIGIDPDNYQQRIVQAEQQLAEDAAEKERIEQERKNLERKLESQIRSRDIFQKELNRLLDLKKRGVAQDSDILQAELDLQRYEDNVIQMETDLELIKPRIKLVEQRMINHEADLQMAKLDLNRTKVVPPFDGYISEVMVEQGQYVRVGDPLLELTDVSVVEVPVAVPLDDYLKLAPQVERKEYPAVQLAADESSQPRWRGDLVRVAPTADQRTRTVQVYVSVDNREQTNKLLPGTFVNARIAGNRHPDVLVIPREAIVNGEVFVLSPEAKGEDEKVGEVESDSKDGLRQNTWSVEQRPIEVQQYLQSLAIIEAGLEPGERVMLTNLDLVKELLARGDKFEVRISQESTVTDVERAQQIRRWQLLR